VKTGAFYIGFAVLFHLSLAAALIAISNGSEQTTRPREPQNVVVTIKDPTPIEEESPAVEPKPPRTEPSVPEPIKAAPRPVKRAPIDPVDVSKTPTLPTPARRVVGISFESTVEGGKGPALAVGNTRMGETGPAAENPSSARPASGERYSGKGADTENQVAALIPMDGSALVKPKRNGTVEPEYPSVLKAQGIEGDTTVLVRLSETGLVLEVKIVKSSGQKGFDDAAVIAAKKERFEPATRNGEPIPYTLKYTYRFQIKAL
jgi:protein TonB